MDEASTQLFPRSPLPWLTRSLVSERKMRPAVGDLLFVHFSLLQKDTERCPLDDRGERMDLIVFYM